jgi:hypothetical protein
MMMKIATAIGLAALMAGTASAAERSWSPGKFDQIEVRGPYDVVVTTGGDHSVRAEGDSDDLERLEIRVDGDRLIVSRERERGMRGWFGGGGDKVRILVSAEQIREASLSGSGDLIIDRVNGDEVKLAMSGSGDIEVGAISAGKARLAMSGSGDISAAGACREGSLSMSGSGDIHAGDLACETVEVSVAGSGDVEARAAETANVKIAGSGDVRITGGARCTSKVAGSGSVDCS